MAFWIQRHVNMANNCIPAVYSAPDTRTLFNVPPGHESTPLTNAPSQAGGEAQEQSGGGFSFLPQPTPQSQPTPEELPRSKRPGINQQAGTIGESVALWGMGSEPEDAVRPLGAVPMTRPAASSGVGGQDDDTCCLFQQLIRSKGVQCSVRPGDTGSRGSGPSRSVTPPTTEQQKGTKANPSKQTPKQKPAASAEKIAKAAELTSTLEALETLWVSSGQAALTPRRVARKAAEEALSNDRAPTMADSAAGAAVVSQVSNRITPPLTAPSAALIPPVVTMGSSFHGSAMRTLSPGTSKLLAQVYGMSAR